MSVDKFGWSPLLLMYVLLLHAWLRGNLGDELITRQVVGQIRRSLPCAHLHIVSVPPDEQYFPKVSGLADQFTPRRPSTDVKHLISLADMVVIAPGGGLQKPGDRRACYIYRDARCALKMGKQVIFAGHSFCESLCEPDILQQCAILTREPHSFRCLLNQGVPSQLGADYGFLLDQPAVSFRNEDVLCFLRFDNFHSVAFSRGILMVDDRKVPLPKGRVVLASSDHRRDGPRLIQIAKEFGIVYEPSYSIEALSLTIAAASHVVTDRFHPAIIARLAGTPLNFIPQAILRDHGLLVYLQSSIAEVRRLAQQSLTDLDHALRQ